LLEVPLKAEEFSPLKLPGYEVPFLIPTIVQFEARAHGDHAIQALVDGQRLGHVVNMSIRPPLDGNGEGDDDAAAADGA
jgi:hypothetical protein